MNHHRQQRPLDLDRYRRRKEKGLVSPRAGAAVVAAVPSMDSAPLSPDPAHHRSMMPVASAYRDAPQTPQMISRFACSDMLGGTSGAPKPAMETPPDERQPTPSGQRQMTNSLFDEAKRQRYDKFKSRVRKSQSPQNGAGTVSHFSNDPEPRQPRAPRQQDTTKPRNSGGGRQKSPFGKLRRGTEAFDHMKSGGRVAIDISPSKRSAFSSPKTDAQIYRQRELVKSPASYNYADLPAPPSTIQQLSSHRMNSFGLPIASASHDTESLKSFVGDEGASLEEERQESSVLPAKRTQEEEPRYPNAPLPTTKQIHPLAPPTPEQRSKQERAIEHELIPTNLSIEKRPFGAPPAFHRLAAQTSSRRQQIAKLEQSRQKQSSKAIAQKGLTTPSPKKPPRAGQLPQNDISRASPQLSINPESTPSARPSSVQYASSSERGVTPPPVPPSKQMTPKSVDNSTSTSSSARRDRILEARGMEEQEIPIAEECHGPLSEIYTASMDRVESVRSSSPAPSLQIRPSLEMPSLKSHYSSESQMTLPSQGQDNQLRKSTEGTTPVDFYRRITAAKTQQLAFARRHRGTTPSRSKVESPAQRASPTPVSLYRIESTRETKAPELDLSTVRLLYSYDFTKLIQDQIFHHTERILRSCPVMRQHERHGVSFVARKRPLLTEEIDGHEFDVVHAETGKSNAVIVFQTSLFIDLQTKDVKPSLHAFDHVFSEHRTEEEFYIRTGQPAVLQARKGGTAAIVIFGSKGSGKTRSMADIEERAVYDLFDSSTSGRPRTVSIQYLKLAGNHITDLLGPVGSFVRIVDEGGCYRFKGSMSKSASDPNELISIISDAKRRLAKTATVQNRDEGQSYLLSQIVVHQEWHLGSLTLLRCPEDDRVNGDENSTMFDSLMESIRARASGRVQNNPLRGVNNITKALQDSLEDPRSRICLLATVSPAASRTEATLGVLSSLSRVQHGNKTRIMQPTTIKQNTESSQQENISPASTGSATDLTLPRQWDHADLVRWMQRKNLMGNPVPSDVNGRFAMRMSKRQLKNTFYDVMDNGKADKLFIALRAENDRVARMRVKIRMARDRQRFSETY